MRWIGDAVCTQDVDEIQSPVQTVRIYWEYTMCCEEEMRETLDHEYEKPHSRSSTSRASAGTCLGPCILPLSGRGVAASAHSSSTELQTSVRFYLGFRGVL